MKIDGLHEKEIFEKNYPFRLIENTSPDFSYPPHWHNAVELLYIVRNDFIALVNSKEYRLEQGSILFIPSGDIHEFHSPAQTGCRIFINFELLSLGPYEIMEGIKGLCGRVCLIKPEDGQLYDSLKRQIGEMLDQYQPDGVTSQLYCIARMIDIMVLLGDGQMKVGNMANSRALGIEKIKKSFEYIEKYYNEDIHLEDIAKALGFSEYYFSRLFKEITEKGFHQYLSEYRVKKAENLLKDVNRPISDVAYASGFGSITTFNRAFKQIKGCTPQEYRKLHV